ncbi:MAG: hypothetical protein FD143_924 [Ignavibacteria bacterium]|nr:MAG: hypothetical protein FD143_924 [Ignavibacteria bacterium]KAF0161167.1 MAG: hypothetical protein FD188_1078 [Ignavibacteria bacterium]
MHSKNRLGFVFLALLFSYSCREEQKSDKIVVKLKESVLTKTMLDSALSSSANSAKLKEEFINDWIETEVLYREAINEGIQDNTEYISLVNRSKKELAGTLYIKKLVADNELIPSDNEVEEYFNNYKEDFKLKEDLYKLFFLRTSFFEKAVQARTKILESGWNKTKDFFRTDSTLTFSSVNLYKSEIEPVVLLRVINSLITNETSIILETEPGIFVIVSIEEKFAADSIPPFEVAKERAKNLLTALQQKEFVKEHIKKLVEEHNLEIERYTE